MGRRTPGELRRHLGRPGAASGRRRLAVPSKRAALEGGAGTRTSADIARHLGNDPNDAGPRGCVQGAHPDPGQGRRPREVTATGTTTAAAERALREKLVDRAPPTRQAITADTTISTLAALWLAFLREE